MKWLVVLSLMLLGFLSAAMADDGEVRSSPADYTSRYAELASPLPSHVNVQELLASLASFHH